MSSHLGSDAMRRLTGLPIFAGINQSCTINLAYLSRSGMVKAQYDTIDNTVGVVTSVYLQYSIQGWIEYIFSCLC